MCAMICDLRTSSEYHPRMPCQICAVTHSYVCHKRSCVHHDSSICVTGRIHMCDMTHSYVCHGMRFEDFISMPSTNALFKSVNIHLYSHFMQYNKFSSKLQFQFFLPPRDMRKHMYGYTFIWIFMRIYVYKYVHMYIYVYVYIHIYIYSDMCRYTHTYV